MRHIEFDDELDSYADTHGNADLEAARNILIDWFPHLDEEELIELEEGRLMRYTVNRVMETMLHNNGAGFTMNRTFSNEVFYRAKEEAYDMMLWVESDDDTPKPDTLKYKAPETAAIDVEDDEAPTKVKETRKNAGPYTRRARGKSPTSKYQQALTIVRSDLANNVTRKDTVLGLIEKFGLNKTTAESYYSKAKSEEE